MSKKLVVVCGATGAQGGSVVNALLNDERYAVRGLTRDMDGTSSQELIARGVEMVSCQPGDKASVAKAFEGAYAVFGVTVPSFTIPGQEYEHGKNLADACRINNVPLFVWSSLPSIGESSNGKAFDEKAEVDKYIKTVGQPAVVFKTGGFTSNLIRFGQLRRDPQDFSKWHIHYPWVRGSVTSYRTYVEKDLGPAVVAVINHWEDSTVRVELEKEPIPLCSYVTTGDEDAQIISRVSGKDVDYICEHPTEGLNAHPMLKQMYQWNDEGYRVYPDGAIPSPILTKLGVRFHTFEDYVKETLVPFMRSQQ
ncbi:NAD(P)-binding protein [Calocera cornea HHB12733]|uniref:NAD(P)-binding protein n=1 Tax=Calocera cornea HHB12733 TaxID=1353952 RepID=A0A165HZZ0_9BASI|nr:NAD(P)-binding protein [Calocera cornea HHB12733]